LENHYLIDFPGILDHKLENEIAHDIALENIILKAKSTKILFLM